VIEVNDKIRVLITGYSPEGHTSFGSQIRDVWNRLIKTGKYEVIQHGWFHNSSIEKVPWKIIPTDKVRNPQRQHVYDPEDRWGQKSFPEVCSQVKPDLVWTLADLYMIEHINQYRQPLNFKYIQYVPIDGTPVPPRYKGIIEGADKTIGVCKWGAEAMSQMVGYEIPYIYHGVDTDIFKPMDPEQRKLVRMNSSKGRMHDDCFVIGWVGKDQYRKQSYNPFEIMYYLRTGNYVTCNSCGRVTRAKRDFMSHTTEGVPTSCRWCKDENVTQADPIDAMLWGHVFNNPTQGWDLDRLVKEWEITDKVVFTEGLSRDSGMKVSEMASLYSCFDVLISLSGGEGFMIPGVEAQACGVPVAYTDYSGQVEVCEQGGEPIEVSSFTPEVGTHINRAVTCADDAIRVLRNLWLDKEHREQLGSAGRVFAVDEFNHDELCVQHDEIIQSVMKNSVQLMGVQV